MKTLAKLIGMWLAVFLAGKLAFMAVCHGAETLTLSDVLAVLWHGLPMDFSTIIYLIALPGLCLWLCANIPTAWRWGRWMLVVVNTVAAVAVVACIVGDIALFPFWDFKLDATIWTYMDSPADAVASVSAGFIIVHVVMAIAAMVLVIWLSWRIIKQAQIVKHPWPWNLGYVLLAAVCFIVLRGGVTESTMNVGHAYFSDRQFLNQAAVNPAFSLLASSQKTERFDELYRALPDEEAAQLTEGLFDTDAAPVDTLLCTMRPNILLVFWEGCSAVFTDALGQVKDVTPHLDSLAASGIFFYQFYANSFRTDRGTLSTLSGHLAFPTHSLMKMSARVAHLPSIARTLRSVGYSTAFSYGGDINFTNMKGYLHATGFEHLTADRDFSMTERHTAEWGVADSVLCEYLYESLKASPTPFFHAALTLSSHEPWDVPGANDQDSDQEQKYRAFRYTDRCLGRLIQRLQASPLWNDLLVIILPDHGIINVLTPSRDDPELYHIPMVWTGGAVKEHTCVNQLMMQSDLPATLFGQMHLSYSDFPWSRDVLSPDYTRPVAYSSFNDGFVLRDSTGISVWDNKGARLNEETDARVRLGLAIQQRSYDQLQALGYKE